ncbi:thioredoxin family protein [Candidatus Babeliales bacterium]|nr:thioredoxin family protein [Candidatus Babeliales bacterium]
MKFSHKSLLLPFVIFSTQGGSNIFTHPITPPTKIEEVIMADELFKQMTSQKPTIIMGFMNNCPHCKTLTKFFETLPKKYTTINFIMVNGPKLNLHKEVLKLTNNQFKIPGYPSIIFIKNGKIKDMQIGGNSKTLEEKIKILLK